jgi:hypothetical protein
MCLSIGRNECVTEGGQIVKDQIDIS